MTVAEQTDVVTIAIARDPALVRTVRLVAAAVARRSGQDEGAVEEIRLAVGEACAVMIGLDEAAQKQPGEPTEDDHVTVGLNGKDGFRVTVSGRVGAADAGYEGILNDPWMLLRGIDENLTIDEQGDRTTVTVSWPAA